MVMATAKLGKTSQILLKGSDAVDIEVYRKSVTETRYLHLHVTGCDVQGRVTT